MQHHVGIDFGTTNSAIGLAADDGTVRLAGLMNRGDAGASGVGAPHWRTVLYFEPGAPPLAGTPAIERYLANEGEGRLVQSIKSHLTSASFSRTHIAGQPWTLEDLIAAYLRAVRGAAGVELGRRAVIGRPVRYWGAETDADDARAVARMRAAATAAGFDDLQFEYEPIAAAVRYAATLDHDELVLVADFGGGTSDFSLVRVGPHLAPGDPGAILATGGLGVGGDSFDARMIDAVIAPELGRGTEFRDEVGAATTIPAWLYARLRRWHHLSFLRDADTLRLLARIEQGAVDPVRVERLTRLIRDDLGLPLHRAVERAKVALSSDATGVIDVDAIDLRAAVARSDFERWIEPELDAIDAVVTRVLEQAAIAPGEVDAVFATGGSSLVPAVRERLARRFGAARLAGGDELTSVAWGLAARARQLFAPT